jgi:sugar phosphate permease
MTDKFGWKTSFGFLILFGIIGAVLLSFAWKATATRYEELKAETK